MEAITEHLGEEARYLPPDFIRNRLMIEAMQN